MLGILLLTDNELLRIIKKSNNHSLLLKYNNYSQM